MKKTPQVTAAATKKNKLKNVSEENYFVCRLLALITIIHARTAEEMVVAVMNH